MRCVYFENLHIKKYIWFICAIIDYCYIVNNNIICYKAIYFNNSKNAKIQVAKNFFMPITNDKKVQTKDILNQKKVISQSELFNGSKN